MAQAGYASTPSQQHPPQQWLMVLAPVEIDNQQANVKIIKGQRRPELR